jgi:hypothetical protein
MTILYETMLYILWCHLLSGHIFICTYVCRWLLGWDILQTYIIFTHQYNICTAHYSAFYTVY